MYIRSRIIWIIVVLTLLISFTGVSNRLFPQSGQDREPLQYNLEVTAHMVPFFAVDSKGKPVFDLEEKDIEVFVNGKPFPLAHFSRYQFQSREAEPGKPVQSQAVKAPERYVFIINDYLLPRTRAGIVRSRFILEEIIHRSSPGDAFILLYTSSRKGLQYIAGPEKANVFMKRLKVLPRGNNEASKKKRRVRYNVAGAGGAHEFNRRGEFNISYYDDDVRARDDDYNSAVNSKPEVHLVKEAIKNQIKKFEKAITPLKYALRSITAPKIVYLISEGIPLRILEKEHGPSTEIIYYFDYLKKVAQSINTGGSILNVINPAKAQYMDFFPQSGKQSLKFMAEESGGKYFGGSDIELVAGKVENSTSAYYETSFMPETHMKKLRIGIRCKRPGVEIHSIINSEKQTPYRQMPKIQKEIFALNVVTDGSWSRMVGKVDYVKYKKVKTKKDGTRKINVTIPGEMRDRKADVFVIHVDPVTMRSEFEYSRRKLNEKELIEMKFDGKRDHYFVVIDPQTSQCIYNRVK